MIMGKMILLFVTFFCSLTINIYSQQQIAESDYYAASNAASTKRFAASRREMRKDENFIDGKLSSTTMIIDEYIEPNKQRFISITNSDGKVEKLEMITTGKNYYQRENDGAWTKLKDWYGSDGTMVLKPDTKSIFTVEDVNVDNRQLKLHTALYTYKNEYLDKNGLSFTQIKSWITKDGWLLKEEIIIGVLEPRKMRLKRTYDYEYNPKNLQIEAPVIKNRQRTAKKT